MNGVFIVPTGIGAEIGGHAGDASPVAKLVASVCDKLIVHPNVVNASDINEMSDNMLYVEGSILNRFLRGQIGLKEVRSNKILVVHNQPRNVKVLNAVSAARATIGADIQVLELRHPLRMRAFLTNGKANGQIEGIKEAIEQVNLYDFDVLVVNTPIDVETEDLKSYICSDGGTNLWGGVEAMLSKEMSIGLNKPVIHAPVESEQSAVVWRDLNLNKEVDPRKAAEMSSECCLHCCLKGAHRAPRISKDHSNCSHDFYVGSIDFLMTPAHVWGLPHHVCYDANIPVIAVEENKTVLNDGMPFNTIIATDYLQATGIVVAMKAGMTLESLRRPLKHTTVLN